MSVFRNLFWKVFIKKKQSLNVNEALCFYDNIKILVVEKAVIFILSSELDFLVIIYLIWLAWIGCWLEGMTTLFKEAN